METVKLNYFSIQTFEYLQVDIRDSNGKLVYRVLEKFRDRAIHNDSFVAVIKNLGISVLPPSRVINKEYTENDKKNKK